MQQKRRDLPLDVTGIDLVRLEKAAHDLGMSPEELFQQASDMAAEKLFVLPKKPAAVVIPMAQASNKRGPDAAD